MRRAGGGAILALLLALTAISTLGAQAAPAQYDKGLFDLRVGSQLAETDVGLVNDRGAILLPIDRLLTLTGLAALPQSTDSMRAIPAFGSSTPAELDIAQHVIRRLGQTYPIAPDEVVSIAGTWYLASDRVAEFLGAHVVADMSTLRVFVNRDPPFPSEQMAATRERRAVYLVGPQSAEAHPDAAMFIRRTGGISADWNLSASGSGASRDFGLQLALGGAILGGSLSASSAITKQGFDDRVLASSWQYTYANPANDWLRSIQLGNAAAATSGRAIQGVAISNSHLFHSGPFSVTRIAPDVAPGWSYDVYQDGQLVGFADANTRTPVAVRLAYGSTPIEIRFHGPAGEEIRSTYVYQVDIDRVAPGRVEYGAGAGKCPRVADCKLAYGNVSAGLRSWLTASAGAEVVDSATNHFDPFARMIMANATGWKGVGEWTPALRHMRVNYFGPGFVTGSLDAGRISTAGPVASYTSILGDRNFIEPEATFSIRRSGGAPMTLRLESRGERAVVGGASGLRVSSVLSVSRFQGSLQYRDEIAGQGPLLTAGGLWFAPRSWSRFGQPTISMSLGEQHGALGVAQLASSITAGAHGSLNGQLQWSRASNGFSFSLTYNAFTGRLRQSLGISSNNGNPATTSLVVGSFAMYDPTFGLASSDRVSPNSAGIAGRAFYDEDGDGRFGPGDRPASGVLLQAAGQTASADDEGRYRLIGTLPYEPVRIQVDTVDGIEPEYVPATSTRDVRLTPNVLTTFDIPLLKTREVAATLQGDSLIATVGGVTVELREVATGRVYEAATFSDGTLYLSRVMPGTYVLSVSARSLAALHAVADIKEPRVRIGTKGDAPIVLPTIMLRGRRQTDPSNP